MSNRRDLKAFVRYDGSGRVIPGSLILQKEKPKVGDWKKIDAYECCNPTTSTTSTSTTIALQTICFNYVDDNTETLTQVNLIGSGTYWSGSNGGLTVIVSYSSAENAWEININGSCYWETPEPISETNILLVLRSEFSRCDSNPGDNDFYIVDGECVPPPPPPPEE